MFVDLLEPLSPPFIDTGSWLERVSGDHLCALTERRT